MRTTFLYSSSSESLTRYATGGLAQHRSVSYTPAAYYADLLAERGRMMLYSTFNKDDMSDAGYNAQDARRKGGAHGNLKNTMFFN